MRVMVTATSPAVTIAAVHDSCTGMFRALTMIASKEIAATQPNTKGWFTRQIWVRRCSNFDTRIWST